MARLLCQNHGIKPVFISIGIAAGLLFTPSNDELAFKVQEIVSAKGIASAINVLCWIDGSNIMYEMIVEFYRMFKQGLELEEILEKAEKLKRHTLTYLIH